jgi:hypothetical protein
LRAAPALTRAEKVAAGFGESRQLAGGMSQRLLSLLVKPLNDAQSCPHLAWGLTLPDCVASIMIRNGIYLAETTFLDGVEAYNRHVMVLRDGTMRGGGGFY